jgi:hypothetical protein
MACQADLEVCPLAHLFDAVVDSEAAERTWRGV